MKIRVAGLDPALKNFGLAKGWYDIDSGELCVAELKLIETERETSKQVRRNSDDLSRAALITMGVHEWVADCAAVFAEIPSGAQSASAAKALGIATGILAGIGVVGSFKGRLIQVTPAEVKKLATGSKVAAKEEMIEWAGKRWPDSAGWLKVKRKGEYVLVAKNEHLADACGAINAGVHTDQFRSLVHMLAVSQSQVS